MVWSTFAAALALALSAPPECGPPELRPGPRPFRPGESLRYDLDIMGVVRAGSLTLSVERPVLGQLPLRARVRNTSVFAKVREVRGVALSWVDEESLRPARYRDELLENGVRKVSDTRIAGDGPIVIEKDYGGRRESSTFARRREVLDALSALFTLRAARLEPGLRLCFDLVANRRFWRVEAEVAAERDRVETPEGFHLALRIDATAARADQPDKKRPVHLWLSDDERRLPLAVVSEVDFGPVAAKLARVSP